MKFQFYFRMVYGIQKIYPANQVAHQFAHLLGVKTFSDDQVHQIQALGFEIDCVRDPAAQLRGVA